MLVRLCTLLVLLLAPVAAFADESEDRAKAAVKELGGTMLVDTKAPGRPVVAVGLDYTKVTDKELKQLAGFKSLRVLYLNNTAVTDAGLKEVAVLKGMRGLYLSNTKVSDTGVKELTALKSLQTLDLADTKVTDTGLKDLASLGGLKKLYLSGTRVTNEGVKKLQKALPKCQITRTR